MFKQMMVPVDLEHLDSLAKALETAASLAKRDDIPVCYVGIAASQPSTVAHNPAEHAEKMKAFAEQQAEKHGISASSHTFGTKDATTDVDNELLKAVETVGADLVVMATHLPKLADYVWPSNGGKVASHSKASVFLVRN